MRTLLAAKSATFTRSGEPVFEPVDLAVSGGDALVIRGANGSGKTTLLRLLAGILRSDSGHIERHAPVAFLGHRSGMKGDLSCRENLEFAERFRGTRSGIDPRRALTRVGLAGFGLRPARALSAGQQRRLGLASLLVAPAAVWLLDEPYASLDDEGCRLVDELLDEQLARDGAAVLSTHQRQPELARAANGLTVRAHRRAS